MRTSEDPSGTRPSGRIRATIDDVARAAAVSRQTVSNVVHGRGRVSGATKLRVLAAIEQLGYEPHTAAASLRSGRTHRIAYPVPDTELRPDNGIMLEFLQFLVSAARERRHQVLVSTSGSVDGMADLVRTRSVDGFVLATVAEHDPRVEYLAEREVPFACFGRVDPPLPQYWVDIDNRAASREVTELVLAGGRTDVTFVGYLPQGRWDHEREAGYREAMAAAGLPARVVRVPIGTQEAKAAVATLLDAPDRPAAVVAGSDVLAAGCYAAAARLGLRIGVDLAVTGFDGSLVSRLLAPTLTTVAMPLAQIASRLIDRVIDAATGAPPALGEIIPTTLIAGESA